MQNVKIEVKEKNGIQEAEMNEDSESEEQIHL